MTNDRHSMHVYDFRSDPFVNKPFGYSLAAIAVMTFASQAQITGTNRNGSSSGNLLRARSQSSIRRNIPRHVEGDQRIAS